MKTSKKRQDSPKCPKCGGNLRIIEADPNGRPWCDSLACGYVGAATKTPAPAVWGPREDAHITAVEKWLADEWRDDTEINAALGDYVTGRRVVGDFFSPMAFERGRKILKAELKARQAQREGRDVARTGDKVTVRVIGKPSGGDVKETLGAREVLRIVTKGKNGAFIAAVHSEHREGENLIETFRRMAMLDLKAITESRKPAWIGKPQAKDASVKHQTGTRERDLQKCYIDRWADTLKRRYNRATDKSGA